MCGAWRIRRKVKGTQFPCRVRDSIPTFSFLLQAECFVQRAEERGALVVFHQSGIGGFCGGNNFWWIIILILLFSCGCGGNNDCGCTNNNHTGGCGCY